jgi:hypothetical protein
VLDANAGMGSQDAALSSLPIDKANLVARAHEPRLLARTLSPCCPTVVV